MKFVNEPSDLHREVTVSRGRADLMLDVRECNAKVRGGFAGAAEALGRRERTRAPPRKAAITSTPWLSASGVVWLSVTAVSAEPAAPSRLGSRATAGKPRTA